MKRFIREIEIWTKIALTIHYIEQITFLSSFSSIHPPIHLSFPFSPHFVHIDIHNGYKHLINLKLEFLAFDAVPVEIETKNGLNWFERMCVYNFIYYFSHCQWLCVARYFRCSNCLIIYVFFYIILFLSSLLTFVVCRSRFIKHKIKKSMLNVYYYLLLIPEGQLTPKLF